MSVAPGRDALWLASVAGLALLCAAAGASPALAQTVGQTAGQSGSQTGGQTAAKPASGSLAATTAAPAPAAAAEAAPLPEAGGLITQLSRITLFADRQETAVLDVPAHVSVVTGEELKQLGISDMQQLTRYLPGVTVQRQTSATDPFNTFSGFTIRGVGGNRVQMQVDGSRVAERITDGTRDYLDFNFVRQVEVVRGPASVLWGADALGGVVAVETLDPEDVLKGRKMGGEGRVAYDSFNSSGLASGVFAQRWSETFAVMAAVSRQAAKEAKLSNARADGGIYGCPRVLSAGQLPCDKLDPINADSYRGLFKFVWTPSNEHRLEASADLLRRTTDVDYTRTRGVQTNGNVITGYDRDLTLTRNRFALEHSWTPDSGFLDELKTTFAYTPHKYDRKGVQTGRNRAGQGYVLQDYLSYKENFFELDVQATKRFDLGSTDHELTFGFDGDYSRVDYTRLDRTTNLATGAVTEARAGGFNFANSDTRRADVYAQHKIGLFDNKLELTPGLRLATYRINPRPNPDYKVVPGSEPRVREDTALLKSLGALYHIDDTWSVWGKYGEGFKMPTAQQLFTSVPGASFDQIPAPNLKPEKVRSLEAGVRAQIERGYLSITGFRADYTDFIESFYNPPGTNDYTYRNLSEVAVWGVEVEGAYGLTQDLTATASVAWQKGTQKAAAGAASTPHTLPPLTAVLGLSYALPQYNLTLDAMTRMAAPVYETSSPTGFKPGGYAVLDVFASWQVTEMASLDLGVKNVFDTRYFEASAAGMTTRPTSAIANQNPLELQTGPGRTFQASFNVKF
ncbi:TonB-dependent hemoglobin/transferrin/lactoferrin family receptor [Pannonibacter carbonis]|uniref:TonB-dependent hemoglobin/transferrin/lactoferrin family receptor n=1 Tax=Pannonibacter carbonis TaxID=2067569 RepID=UPI000D10B440|nr:TonB-dependent hemoglobin/transferrin/lactoferrin family receptor [Pannonibacter carbonis]